jgi:hypothetical protein
MNIMPLGIHKCHKNQQGEGYTFLTCINENTFMSMANTLVSVFSLPLPLYITSVMLITSRLSYHYSVFQNHHITFATLFFSENNHSGNTVDQDQQF